MDLDWDDIKTILVLVRQGSLSAASKKPDVNYTTVARRIKRAELRLGKPLFDRLADGYVPTPLAQMIADHAINMEDAEHAMMRKMAGEDPELSGPLTITAPQLLIAHAIAPVFDEFAQKNPNVDLNILATNELLDLSRREADLAIRISRNPGDTLKGRCLTSQNSACFASKEWAEKITKDPNAQVDWLVYNAYPTLPDETLKAAPNSNIKLRFDDMVAMAGAAVAGLGVVRMPMFLGRSLGLVQIPNLPVTPYMDIWVVGHADVWKGVKVQAFRSELITFFKKNKMNFVALM